MVTTRLALIMSLLVACDSKPKSSTAPAPTAAPTPRPAEPTPSPAPEAKPTEAEAKPPAGPPTLAPNAPDDKPVQANSAAELAEQNAAMAPYIEQGKKTYPGAKKKYLAGLPAGHHFFVSTKLHSPGAEELVFIAVSGIKGDKITGTIASDILSVKGYKNGDTYKLTDADVYDWMVARPDGTEEGNVVGKFLDTWGATHRH